MEGLAAIDEELEALAEGKDIDAIVAKAREELPDHSESFEMVDAMLENLGEAVSVPTVEPVGVDIPKLELPEIQAVAQPQLAEVPDTDVRPSAPPAEEDIPVTREHEAPQSAVEMAAEADAGVDEVVSGMESESGLDADDLFGDLPEDSQRIPVEDMAVDITDALAQVRAMTSEPPPEEEQAPAEVAEEVAEEAEPEAAEAAPATEPPPPPAEARPRTEPPPPPAEAGSRDSIEELDLDEIMIDDDDFELMIEEEADDTTVGDVEAVEAALAKPAPEEGEGGGDDDDDPREQSFFKKIFG